MRYASRGRGSGKTGLNLFPGPASALWPPLLVCVLAGVLLYASVRAPAVWVLDVGAAGDWRLLDNFYQREHHHETTFRWMGPHARVWLYGAGGGARAVHMRLHGGYLAQAPDRRLQVGIDGRPPVALEVTDPGWRCYRVLLPPGEEETLQLAATSYHTPPGDTRYLSVPLDQVRVVRVGAVPALSRVATQRTLLLVGVVAGAMGLWYAIDRLLWPAPTRPTRTLRVSGAGGLVALGLLLWVWYDRASLNWACSAPRWVAALSALALLLPWWLPRLRRLLDDETRPLARAIVTIVLFAMVGLVLVWPALSWPMVYDDLHLLRPFSPQELANSFVGNWDSDYVETPGLRPFNIILYHGRYLLFGEHVIAHRLAMVGVYALFLTAMCWIAAQVGVPWSGAVVAGLLSLGAKYSVYHYVWLTDGVHLFQGVAFVGAVALLLSALKRGGWWRYALSLAALVVGILTREDTLAVVPVVPLLAGVVGVRRRGWRESWPVLVYTLVLAVLCAGLLAYRALVVVNPEPLEADIRGYLWHVLFTFHPLGIVPFNSVAHVFLVGWWGLLALLSLATVALLLRAPAAWRGALVWLVAALVACTPGLTLVRANLLFFAVPFFCLFAVATLDAVARWSPPLRLLAAGMVVWTLAGGAYTSSVTAHMFHPDSASAVAWNCQFLYGAESGATIPASRRAVVADNLARLGIASDEDRKRVLPRLIAEALAAHRRVPGGDGLLFVPYVQRSLQPQSRYFFREGVR